MGRNLSTEITDYLGDSRGFWNAARAVYEDCIKDDYPFIHTHNPLLFLLGHSVECLLKACLLKQGYDYKFWRDGKNKHDLEFLIRAVNIVNFTGKLRDNIATINRNFSNHDHRYSKTFSGEINEEVIVYSGVDVKGFIDELDKEITRARKFVDYEGYSLEIEKMANA